MRIYRARQEDLDDITMMWKKLSEHHRQFLDYMNPSIRWREWIWESYRDDLGKEDKLVLVAKHNRRNIAFIRAEIRTISELFDRLVTGYISDLFVEEQFRGSGVADQLISEVIKWLNMQSIDNVRLNVNSQNIQALRLYERLGFHEVNKTLVMKF